MDDHCALPDNPRRENLLRAESLLTKDAPRQPEIMADEGWLETFYL